MSQIEAGDIAPRDLPLFHGIADSVREELLGSAVQHRVSAGTVLFEQGEPPNFQLMVMAGSVQLFGRSSEGREVLIEIVCSPDLIIPAAVMTGEPYLMQARVPERSRLLLIPATRFRQAAASDPVLAQAVIGSLAHQFRRMVRQVKNLKLRSSTDRVGCYLLALSARQGTPDRAVLPYEKHLIASELGITRESFSRALAVLEASGIAVFADTIHIRDAALLIAKCRPDPLIDGEEPTWSRRAFGFAQMTSGTVGETN